MKTLLLSACAAIVVATAAFPVAADNYDFPDNGSAGSIIRTGDNGYNRHYDDPYGNQWPYQQPGYQDDRDDDHNDQRHGWGSGWGQNDDWDHGWNDGWRQGGYYGDVLPPRVIVKKLYRRDFTHISRPILAGRWYQVKAIAPNGRKVKLYVDPYSGRIVKAKYRS